MHAGQGWLCCLINIAVGHSWKQVLTPHSLLLTPIKIHLHFPLFQNYLPLADRESVFIFLGRVVSRSLPTINPLSGRVTGVFPVHILSNAEEGKFPILEFLIVHNSLQIWVGIPSFYLIMTIWMKKSQHNSSSINLVCYLLCWTLSVEWAAQYFLPSLEIN